MEKYVGAGTRSVELVRELVDSTDRVAGIAATAGAIVSFVDVDDEIRVEVVREGAGFEDRVVAAESVERAVETVVFAAGVAFAGVFAAAVMAAAGVGDGAAGAFVSGCLATFETAFEDGIVFDSLFFSATFGSETGAGVGLALSISTGRVPITAVLARNPTLGATVGSGAAAFGLDSVFEGIRLLSHIIRSSASLIPLFTGDCA